MTKVVISNYCKKFKDNDLYKNFNVTFYDNNINVIVGPNGSGKTTLINSILGFDKNYLGTITNLTNNSYIFLPDENVLPLLLTGREYILYFMKLHNVKPQININIVSLFNMSLDLDKLISSYSYGMKKKIQIILTGHVKPQVVIMDELFRGLDYESIVITIEVLKKLKKYSNVILTTHDINIIKDLGDNIIVIVNGNKVIDGTICDIEKKYKQSIDNVLKEHIFDRKVKKLLNNI